MPTPRSLNGNLLRARDRLGESIIAIVEADVAEVNEVVVRVGKEGWPAQGDGQLGRRIKGRDELRLDLGGCAPGSLVQGGEILPHRSGEASVLSCACQSDPARERCLLASAWIRLTSTAKRSPPTSSSYRQRCTTVSNRWRNRSLRVSESRSRGPCE
jgi:hypothetical protein